MIHKQLSSLPKKWLIFGGILLCMGGYIIYTNFFSSTSTNGIIYSGAPITVGTGNIQETLTFDGTTAFANTQKLTFGQSDLKVTQVLVEVGDKVKQDQVLATLDSSDVDTNFSTAQSNLALAKLNYEKAVGSEDKASDLLKAQNELLIAQNNLNNIETTIKLTNQEEDNNIQKAQQSVQDAQEDYDDLVCDDCSSSDEKIRNKRNTYQSAIDDLRDITTNIQTYLDSMDKIMFYTNKFGVEGSKASIYIAAKNPGLLSSTQQSFFNLHNQKKEVEKQYNTLSSLTITSVTQGDIESAYQQVQQAANYLMDLGFNARTMFEASVESVDTLTQNQIDSYVSSANNLYTNGRTMKDKATSTMEKIYNLDNNSTESNINKAKQTLDTAQLNLDKLLLNKKNRAINNESQRVATQLSVNNTRLQIEAIEKGYNSTSIQNAYNQYIQAQSNLNTARKRYESYQLIANFDGTVTEMNLQVGDTVNSDSNTYIYVESPNLIQIELSVDQTDILKLTKGDDVSITLDVFEDKVFSGIISEVSTVPVMSNGTSTYTVKAMFEKPEGTTILGGMSATVTFIASQKNNVIIVPNAALSVTNGSYYVTLEDGTQQQVQIGEADSTNTEIISGISIGDTILSMMISNNTLSDSGVSSSTSQSPMGGGGMGGSTTTSNNGGQGSSQGGNSRPNF